MTVERVDRCFTELAAKGKTALVAYVCVGDPNVEESRDCALAALEAGADIVELGVPFSDPTADGPVIAQASYRAIHSGGSLRAALDVSRWLRERSDAPLVLFSYYNPILAYGDALVPKAADEAGIDAFLVVDLPPEEGAELRRAVRDARLGFIPLLAPTSDAEREALAFETASGFIYYVSLTGVTGAHSASLEDAGRHAVALRERARLPVVVGFGIDSADKARGVAAHGVSGIAVGTAIVRAIGGAHDAAGRRRAVGALIAELRRGLDT